MEIYALDDSRVLHNAPSNWIYSGESMMDNDGGNLHESTMRIFARNNLIPFALFLIDVHHMDK